MNKLLNKNIVNKKIFFIRHGETKYNKENRCQGVLDSSLTKKGIEQAERNGILLNDILKNVVNLDIAFFSSPLGRTKNTSEIIIDNLKEKNIKVIYDSRIKEVNLGKWGGKTVNWILEQNRSLNSSNFSWYFNSPNGESFKDTKIRAIEFIDYISNLKENNIVIVSHGLFGIVFRSILLNMDYDECLNLKAPQNGIYYIYKDKSKFMKS